LFDGANDQEQFTKTIDFNSIIRINISNDKVFVKSNSLLDNINLNNNDDCEVSTLSLNSINKVSSNVSSSTKSLDSSLIKSKGFYSQ